MFIYSHEKNLHPNCSQSDETEEVEGQGAVKEDYLIIIVPLKWMMP